MGLRCAFWCARHYQQFADYQNTVAESANGQEGIISGYTTFNVAANYKLTKDVKVFMNGYNISDKRYIASRIDGIQPGQGFQMMGGVKWAF